MGDTNRGAPLIGGKVAVIIALLVCVVSGVVIYLMLAPKGPEVELSDYPGSRYARDDAGQVWFLIPGDGYQPVEGADADTFEPVPGETGRGYVYSGLGRDRDHFYALGQRVQGVAPDSVRYLEAHYYLAGDKVYYGTTLLDGADPGTFRVFKNDGVFWNDYAHDDQRLYYQGRWISGADIPSLSRVGVEAPTLAQGHYLRDARRVYYRGRVVEGARPARFTLVEVWGEPRNILYDTHYGYDGQRYFLGDQALPGRVADTDQALVPGGLKVLVADKSVGWHFLFYQGDTFYYHQPFTNELKTLCRRDSSAPIEVLGRGLYRDDRHVYYAWAARDYKKGRYFRGLRGWYSGLEVVPGADPDDVQLIGKRDYRMLGKTVSGDLYQSNGQRFFNPADGDRAALWGVDESDEVQPLARGHECEAYTRNPDWVGIPVFARNTLVFLAVLLLIIKGGGRFLRRVEMLKN